MASEHVTHVTESSFQASVLDSEVPVLVDFWAVWCGPCKAIAPTLDKMAVDYGGRLRVAKVDVDKERGIAMKYAVRNIPTLLLFKGGQVVDQRVGALNRNALDEFVSKAM